jgi:hypothetical protein
MASCWCPSRASTVAVIVSAGFIATIRFNCEFISSIFFLWAHQNLHPFRFQIGVSDRYNFLDHRWYEL